MALALPGCGRDFRESPVRDIRPIDALTVNGSETSIAPSDLAKFSQSLAGALYLPSDANYDDARRIWNGMIDNRPALIAQCADAVDVEEAVRFSAERELLVSVRGGGHSYSGKSVCNGGLMIDLSRMYSVEIDTSSKTATVSGGALLAHLDSASLERGLLTTSGIVSHTGVGGFTLGGGMGRVDRLFGLAIDNVLEATIVTANGETVRASDDENSDLFWAIRGGGGNFGVVTEFVYRLHPFDDTVYGGSLVFSFDHARELLELYAETVDRLPDEANIEPGFEHDDGERFAYISFCVAGDRQAAAKICEPFSRFAKPLDGKLGATSYGKMQTRADGYFAHGRQNYLKSGLLQRLTPDLITAMVDGYEGHMLPDVWFQHLGGATAEIAADTTAFVHRDAIANLGISATWDDVAQSAERIAAVRGYYDLLEPFMKGYYSNLNDQSVQEDWGNYGSNYPRLADIKAQYDPGNLFRLNANIKPDV
jgi:FAD/FMN-containing dehydrogenase